MFANGGEHFSNSDLTPDIFDEGRNCTAAVGVDNTQTMFAFFSNRLACLGSIAMPVIESINLLVLPSGQCPRVRP